MIFIELPDDILSIVLQNVNIMVLLNVLKTCKKIYNMRKIALVNDATILAYKEYYPESNFLRTLFNSNVIYNENMNLKRRSELIDSDEFIYNGYKMYVFDNIYKQSNYVTRNLLNTYCRLIVEKKYFKNNYPKDIQISRDLLYNFTKNYDWTFTNINICDIYHIIICIRYKKYKNLVNIIKTIQIENISNINEYIKFAINIINYISTIPSVTSFDKIQRACIACLLIKFLNNIDVENFGEKFRKVASEQTILLPQQIEGLKIPKYLKIELIYPFKCLHNRLSII